MTHSKIDPALRARLIAGDPTAAAEFLELYKKPVCRRLSINLRRFSDPNAARPAGLAGGDSFRSEIESQFNNAYTKVMEKIRNGELDDSLSPVAYMTMIASNRWLDGARKRKRYPSSSLDNSAEPATTADSDSHLLAADVFQAFERFRDLFSEIEQAVFQVRYVEGQSIEDTAKRLNCTRDTVRARSSSVIKKLRELLQANE